MQPILFTLRDPISRASPSGVGPLRGMQPLPTQPPIAIFGVTRDSVGNPLPGCTLKLFRTSDNAFIESLVSDGSGAYRTSPVSLGQSYYLVASKDGAPAVTGATLNSLEGS